MVWDVLQTIARNIQQSKLYSIIGDETLDISNKGQLVLCIRWVDDNLQVHEDFVGFHHIPNTSASNEIVNVIKLIDV